MDFIVTVGLMEESKVLRMFAAIVLISPVIVRNHVVAQPLRLLGGLLRNSLNKLSLSYGVVTFQD